MINLHFSDIRFPANIPQEHPLDCQLLRHFVDEDTLSFDIFETDVKRNNQDIKSVCHKENINAKKSTYPVSFEKHSSQHPFSGQQENQHSKSGSTNTRNCSNKVNDISMQSCCNIAPHKVKINAEGDGERNDDENRKDKIDESGILTAQQR